MSVDADGFVKHCGNLNMAFGKIQESEIMDLWHNELTVKLRKSRRATVHTALFVQEGPW